MPDFFIIYDDETVEHLALHGVTIEDFQAIVNAPLSVDESKSSGRVVAFGFTADGRYLACIYECLDEQTILPFTAYEVEP